jgi:hypothetical protein
MLPEQTPDDKTPMTTLTALVEKATKDGYTNNFIVKDDMLFSADGETSFAPEQVKISNFYRFEGESDPDDEAILYLIETQTGIKGIVVSAYGPGADTSIHNFIEQVHKIHKVLHDKEEKRS